MHPIPLGLFLAVFRWFWGCERCWIGTFWLFMRTFLTHSQCFIFWTHLCADLNASSISALSMTLSIFLGIRMPGFSMSVQNLFEWHCFIVAQFSPSIVQLCPWLLLPWPKFPSSPQLLPAAIQFAASTPGFMLQVWNWPSSKFSWEWADSTHCRFESPPPSSFLEVVLLHVFQDWNSIILHLIPSWSAHVSQGSSLLTLLEIVPRIFISFYLCFLLCWNHSWAFIPLPRLSSKVVSARRPQCELSYRNSF